MTSENIYSIVVLYNKNLSESITFNCLKSIDSNIQIFICDNSDNKKYAANNKIASNYKNVHYKSMNGNKGLPSAYNAAIEDIVKLSPGWICLFDDDTFVPAEYFTLLSEAKRTQKADIYLPLVYDEIGLLSPNIMKKYFCHRANSIDEINIGEISAINSGMVLSSEIFKTYRYDENYFLDFVDHAFMSDMRCLHKKVAIFNCKLKQNFAANTNDIASLKKRFKILKKDLRYFYSKLNFGLLYYLYIISKRKIRIFLNVKKASTLFW